MEQVVLSDLSHLPGAVSAKLIHMCAASAKLMCMCGVRNYWQLSERGGKTSEVNVGLCSTIFLSG